MSLKRRDLVLWAAVAPHLPAWAQTTTNPASAGGTRRYAVLSMLGDSLTLVTHGSTTSRHLDNNLKDTVPVSDTVFDHTALVAAHEMIRSVEPGAPVKLLAASGAAAFAEQARWLDGDKFLPPTWLAAALADSRASHLVLLTKHRSPARLQFYGEMGGDGLLEGLGFYIDVLKSVIRVETGERTRGYLAPYAHFMISIIDVARAARVRQHVVGASEVLLNIKNEGGINPWDAVDTREKILRLQYLIDKEIERALPGLVKAL
jgi:hypothetical protein